MAAKAHALNAPAFRSELLLVPMDIPKTFFAALKAGWHVAGERTVLAIDRKHRHGTVVLRVDGRPERLSVAYTMSKRAGYKFAKPKLI